MSYIQAFDEPTLVVRWIALVLAIMGIGKFGPGFLNSLAKLVGLNKNPVTDEDVRGLGWTLMCLGTMPLSFNFFNRVYHWNLGPWETGFLSLLGPTLATLGMTIGLIGAGLFRYRTNMRYSLKTLVLTYTGFIVMCGLFGFVLIHV